MEYNLLEKTEIWIQPIEMTGVDLNLCARSAAEVLGLNPSDVMVTDVLDDTLTLDVLLPTVTAEKIMGKEEPLLEILGAIPGVRVTSETQVHSQGILGLIALDPEVGGQVLEQSEEMRARIEDRIRRRVLVFSSGSELLSGQIRDTNTPFLIEALASENFEARQGPTLADSLEAIAKEFCDATENGYGVLITTGGVGAEGKDQTLEALSNVDPDACMPYILKFNQGTGRHKKNGVRIGVGQLGDTIIICLPGPHDELQLAWPVLRDGLTNQWSKEALANALAEVLRQKFLFHNPHQSKAQEHL